MAVLTQTRSNEEWTAAIRAHDGRALAELRTYLCRSLDSVLAGRAGQSDAEDFAQQAVTRVIECLDQFRGDSRFTTWASSIAVRIALSEVRRKRWGDLSLNELLERGAPLHAADTRQTGFERSARHELLHALRDAIAHALSDRQRAAILGELHGMPTPMLCNELGTTPGALYKLHHDARKRLKRHLESAGFSAEDVRFALQGASEQQ